MFDWNTILGWLLPPGFLITLGVAIFRAYRKRRAGALTRAASTAKELAKMARLYDYIAVLQDDATSHGYKPRPWPRGLKPQSKE